MLKVNNIHFSYDNGARLLDGVSLDVDAGDVVWVQGDNGSGKSTLLRIMAQLTDYEGIIVYNGKNVRGDHSYLREVVYLPPDPYLFDYLSGYENARFLLNVFAVLKSDYAKFEKYASEFGIADDLHRHVQEYSLGMRHKLFWSAMLARNATLWLLDEPFSSFDASTQRFVEGLLKEMTARGISVILVTHIDDIGTRLATRCIRLEGGHLLDNVKKGGM